MAPVAVAGLVAEAVTSRRFWILTHPDSAEIALRRWQSIAAGEDPGQIRMLPDSAGQVAKRATRS
jgi:hypothetical protein